MKMNKKKKEDNRKISTLFINLFVVFGIIITELLILQNAIEKLPKYKHIFLPIMCFSATIITTKASQINWDPREKKRKWRNQKSQ